MHRQRSDGSKRGGAKWLSSRSSFRVDKQPSGCTVDGAVAGQGGANHGGGAAAANCGKILEDTSLTEPASSGSSTNTNTKKGLDDFALPNWEMPSTSAPSATGNTTAVLPPAYQRRGGGFQPPPPPQQSHPSHHPQQQQQQQQHTNHSASREFSQQQHRRPHQNDDIENMLVTCNDSQGSIADDITYLTTDEYSEAEGSRGGSRDSSPNHRCSRKQQGLSSPAAGYHRGARGGGGVAPYSRRQDDDLDYRDHDRDDGNCGDYHHPYLHGHQSQQQQQQQQHQHQQHHYGYHQDEERSRQSGRASVAHSNHSSSRASTSSRLCQQPHQQEYVSSSSRGMQPSYSNSPSHASSPHRGGGVDNRKQAPYDRHLLDDGRNQRSSPYGGRDGGGRYPQEQQQYGAPPARHNMPYEGAARGDPRAAQVGTRRPALYDDHVKQAAELNEDEMLELAMEQSLAETTNRRGSGGGRSQSLVSRETSQRSLGNNTRRSYSGGASRFSRRNSLEGNPMAMHMPPPPSEDDSNKPQPDFIWKKGPNNRYYKCPISELNEEELEEAAAAASSRDQFMSEEERLAQIEQDILEQAMEASIAEARRRPGAVKIPPSSHLNHNNRNLGVPANRQRCNTAPQYSDQQRPLSLDDDDYEEEEEQFPGKTKAEIEQEELLIRLALERSMRDGDNGSVHGSQRPRQQQAPRQRRGSMPTQYPDGHWGDRSPVRQELTVSPHQSRRGTVQDYADHRRGHALHRNNSDDSLQMHGSFSSRRSSFHGGGGGGGGDGDVDHQHLEGRSVNSGGAFVWKKTKGGRYYKAPIDSIEEMESASVPPIIGGIPSMPHLETEAQRLARMEHDMLRVAMERSMMEN